MANEVTIFTPEIEQALYSKFDPIRMFAKQIPVDRGAKTISIPSAGILTYNDINLNSLTSAGAGVTYPVAAGVRTDTEQTFILGKHEFKPIVIADYDEFVTNYEIRASVLQDVANLLGAFAIRTILNGFWSRNDAKYESTTTGTTTYVNRWGKTAKVLTLKDVALLAKKLDIQKVPRDDNRYLVLDPEMFAGFIGEMAAARWVDAASQAFQTGFIPNVHGFKVVMLPEVGVSTTANGALRTPYTQGGASTDANFGFALHKSFVGFAESGVRLFIDENSPGYYGTVLSGSLYAGGKYLRNEPIGCITVYEAQ